MISEPISFLPSQQMAMLSEGILSFRGSAPERNLEGQPCRWFPAPARHFQLESGRPSCRAFCLSNRLGRLRARRRFGGIDKRFHVCRHSPSGGIFVERRRRGDSSFDVKFLQENAIARNAAGASPATDATGNVAARQMEIPLVLGGIYFARRVAVRGRHT